MTKAALGALQGKVPRTSSSLKSFSLGRGWSGIGGGALEWSQEEREGARHARTTGTRNLGSHRENAQRHPLRESNAAAGTCKTGTGRYAQSPRVWHHAEKARPSHRWRFEAGPCGSRGWNQDANDHIVCIVV